jgi:hypothetical protein
MTEQRLVIKGFVGNSFDLIGVYDADSKMSRLRKIADTAMDEGYDYVRIIFEERDWLPFEDNGVGGFIDGGWGDWEECYTDYEVMLSYHN